MPKRYLSASGDSQTVFEISEDEGFSVNVTHYVVIVLEFNLQCLLHFNEDFDEDLLLDAMDLLS
jgi:hypothetical protein